MKRLKRMIGLALALCLWATSALAGTAGLDAALSPYLDINQDVKLSVGYELKTLMPYNEDSLSMLNGVLKHIAMTTQLEGENALMNLTVDGQSLMTIDEKHEGESFTMTTSLLPNRTLVGTGDGLAALLGEEEAPEVFAMSAAVKEAEECYQKLTDAIAPYAEEKAANYKITGVGQAKWVRLAKLTAEQSTELLPHIIALLGCGMDEAFRQELQTMTCKNDFTIALYRTAENGSDLAVYMKGNVSMGEGDARTLAYQWAFSREAEKSGDTYKLELLKNKAPVRRTVVAASLKEINDNGKLSVSMDSSLTQKTPEKTLTTTEKHSLKGTRSDAQTALSGAMSTAVKTSIDGKVESVTTTMEPELTLTSAEGSGVLSGSIAMTEKRGKKLNKSVILRLDGDPAQALSKAAENGSLYAVTEETDANTPSVSITIDGSSLAQNSDEVEKLLDSQDEQPEDYLVGKPPVGLNSYSAPEAMQTVDLDSITPEALLSLREELYQNMAGMLLTALAALPGEDGRLLKDNMTDDDYSAFMNLISEL